MEAHDKSSPSIRNQYLRINLAEPSVSPDDKIKAEVNHNALTNDGSMCMNNAPFSTETIAGHSLMGPDQPYYPQNFSQSSISDPNFVLGGSFQYFYNSKNQMPYSQPLQNLADDHLNPNIQGNLPSDFPLFSVSGNPKPYESSLYSDETIESRSVSLAQLEMNSARNYSTTPPNPFLSMPYSPSSAHQSPSLGQSHFQQSPKHSRHSSLGPVSAGFHGIGSHMRNVVLPQFRGHRRAPSEYSDISASSVQHSPNPAHHDNFDQHQSPMLTTQDSSLYQEVLGIGNFSLSEPQVLQHAQSPQSSSRSPVITPQLEQGQMSQQTRFVGIGGSSEKCGIGQTQNIFSQEPFPSLNQEMGKAKQMIPPEINVEFAPASRQSSFEPSKPTRLNQDALTPPDKGLRRRAFTDTTNTNSNIVNRAQIPHSVPPQTDSYLIANSPNSRYALSQNHGARTISPSRVRRQSTPSMPNRNYVLGLSDLELQAATPESGNNKRAQKHPATFQCSLCPKKFTRAYNLRSHLRTHTDERPFICTVCSKAFARQHDRKRHEGLHSGEKKFICKGDLKQGGQWGCGRRFARADALGRHFRSEAGRICINLLLEEESQERLRAWDEQQIQNLQQMQSPASRDVSGNFMLPAALLVQYPALANLSWSELPQGDVGFEDDISGRSSFDASGSEYYDEVEEGGYVSSGPIALRYI
ncbi:BgTH12-01343 [Blumeria graminis f. sp. triticale]|uniref:Bgt-2417 n=4 Tax=Blumeria graminis TaxID=34373 RepID=A0A9X9MPE8_BLUGR|nr:BgTH12-01343 [Blumeria graminis f. sp. triticale]VDB94026.1 Bgt-2417 [Blumeria graminis f. sp. tritici]